MIALYPSFLEKYENVSTLAWCVHICVFVLVNYVYFCEIKRILVQLDTRKWCLSTINLFGSAVSFVKSIGEWVKTRRIMSILPRCLMSCTLMYSYLKLGFFLGSQTNTCTRSRPKRWRRPQRNRSVLLLQSLTESATKSTNRGSSVLPRLGPPKTLIARQRCKSHVCPISSGETSRLVTGPGDSIRFQLGAIVIVPSKQRLLDFSRTSAARFQVPSSASLLRLINNNSNGCTVF